MDFIKCQSTVVTKIVFFLVPLYPVTLKSCPEPFSVSMERITSRLSPPKKLIAVLLKNEEERRYFVVELFFM